ncbi:hypothetical protein Z949_3107 [Sulfitobacter guttiformis KCTC 32187]|nr:hypothetical protein Z949_3107 [Sulfitobacter guttiformis KCTC 32187]
MVTSKSIDKLMHQIQALWSLSLLILRAIRTTQIIGIGV